jgi:hypothetical protein
LNITNLIAFVKPEILHLILSTAPRSSAIITAGFLDEETEVQRDDVPSALRLHGL